MSARQFDGSEDLIDSRDIIARIEELEEERQALEDAFDEAAEAKEQVEDGDLDLHDAVLDAREALTEWDASEEAEELAALKALEEEASASPDWSYGETIINGDYFTKYIKDLIDDCYEMPKEMNSGAWPWRHVTIDYEAAADEAKQDYMEVTLLGNTFFIRA